MSDIPFEILSLFVEELGLRFLDHRRDTKTRVALQNCTLVCSYLRPQAQRYLFDHTTIYDRRGETLLRMLEANPILALHIRSFAVEVKADAQFGWCDPLVRMEPIIQTTRSLCRLTLSGVSPVRYTVPSPSFTELYDKAIGVFNHLSSVDTLRELSIRNFREFDPAFLLRLPGLQNLQLEGIRNHGFVSPSTGSIHVPHIQTLKIHDYTTLHSVANMLRGAHQNQKPMLNLRHLQLRFTNNPSIVDMEVMVNSLAHSLKELEISDPYGANRVLFWLVSCRALIAHCPIGNHLISIDLHLLPALENLKVRFYLYAGRRLPTRLLHCLPLPSASCTLRTIELDLRSLVLEWRKAFSLHGTWHELDGHLSKSSIFPLLVSVTIRLTLHHGWVVADDYPSELVQVEKELKMLDAKELLPLLSSDPSVKISIVSLIQQESDYRCEPL